MEICNKENCTGCFACVNICPQNCLRMEETSIGHIYPLVDKDKCVNCGLCKQVCPQNKDLKKQEKQIVYAAWSLDENERKISSSGGLAQYFSRRVIEVGGVVYGCSSVIERGEVKHVRCETIEELKALKGSKYTQSFINDTFLNCRKDLKDGREVLFIGTPCQIAGLRSFLGKEYENLLTIDLVCHGVPPQKLLFEHLQDVDFPISVSFRGEDGYQLKIFTKNEIVKRSQFDDLYFIGFNKALYYRESCYRCKYATKERVGDVTLGDFWGLGKNVPFERDQRLGVSLCILNGKKGETFFERFKDGLFFEERSIEEAVEGNSNLRRSTYPHKNKELFEKTYEQKGFKKAAKKALKFNIIKYKILKIIQSNRLLNKIFMGFLD